jgi:hypothetical protein
MRRSYESRWTHSSSLGWIKLVFVKAKEVFLLLVCLKTTCFVAMALQSMSMLSENILHNPFCSAMRLDTVLVSIINGMPYHFALRENSAIRFLKVTQNDLPLSCATR